MINDFGGVREINLANFFRNTLKLLLAIFSFGENFQIHSIVGREPK